MLKRKIKSKMPVLIALSDLTVGADSVFSLHTALGKLFEAYNQPTGAAPFRFGYFA